MARRTNIYVVYNKGKKKPWAVKREGRQAARRFKMKKRAVKFAKMMGRRNQPSEVKVQKRNGKWQQDRGATYRGDTNPPPG